ncbi:LPD23 domain-containing protein [Ruthenibacterium lactatiformans]|nr:LPD23 domain-containing protein [Ruthenibacterium lactatiformans]
MQKSVKKSNKKTGAAGKYTASGAFGGAQPSNLVELIEAQRGKAASSAGKKPAADTALANKWADLQLQSFGQFGADPAAIVGQQAGQTVGGWLHSSAAKPKDTALANEWANLQLQSFGQFGADPAAIAGQQAGQTAGGWLRSSAAKPKNTALANEWANLQLQSFGQFGADTLSPTWGRVEETPEMTAAEREREAQWYEQNANAYNALGADGQSTVQRANDAANRWDIANNMYPWMLDTSGLGMPIDQQLAMADAYEERRQATAALEQAANSLPADVDARSLSRYAQQLENARYAQELETSARQGAGEAPILHNAASVAANAWNLPAALDYAKQWARNTFTGDYAPIDVNTPAQTMNIYRDAVRDETGRNIEEGLGGGLAGKAASFVYQTGMSWADSLANMAMSGGNPYLSGVLMGSGTMTSTVRSAKEKGASDSQAMGAGVAAGIFEGLFEQYSIENLSWMAKSDPRTFLDVVKNLGKSILGEGSEELFTELANAAADTLIMGDLSDYNLAVRQYRAQGESEEEARRHAGWDVAKQAGLAFAGGGLMGFGSAAGGMAYNGAANRYAAPRAVESGSFYNALQYGLAQGEDTAAGRLARELAGRDTASSADVMRMLRAAESRQAEGGPGAQALVDPQLYTRAEVQGMSAGEVRENYDAIRESMEMWDENGELQGGTQSRMVDRQAPGTDNSGSSTAGEAWHAAQNTEQFSGGAIDGGQGVSEKSGWNSKDGGAVYRGEGQSSNARRIRRIAQENAEQFQRSARERGKQQIERHGGASYAYTIAKQPEGAAKQIADGLSARGIEAIVIDAPLETNQNGVTVERGDAVTGPDGRVYIYNGTALNPDSVLAHESVHAAVRKNKPEAHDFVSAIDQATDKSSYYYLACAQIINEAHYDGQLDLTTQEGQAAVRDEMAAYWAGAYNSKNAEELELLSCIDAQQAFTAWNAFNTFENIDAAAGKTKTGDISATTDIQNGSVPTLKAPSHTISPVSNSRIAQTGENATGFSGPAAERTSDVSAVPPALNPAPRLYTRAEVQGMSAGEVRENYDAIQESMRLWDKNGELLQSAETETARRMALETGRAGKTDLDWLEHLAGTAKMELQYVFQPGSGVQAAVQGRRITVNLGGEGYAFGAAVHELGHSMKAADAKAYAKFESAVLGLAQSDAALEQIARQTAADYLSPDSPARAGLLDAQGNIDAAALNEEISLRLAQELVADPEKLVRAVERDRGLMETFLDFVRGLKNRIAIRLSGSERAMLDEAERTLVNLLRGEAGSVAGEKYSFVGEKANLNRTERAALETAKGMEQDGETNEDIRRQTGWFRGADGKWRMEVDDSDAVYYRNGNARQDGAEAGQWQGKSGTLRDYLYHPTLERLEPQVFEVPMQVVDTLPPNTNARYRGRQGGIEASKSAQRGSILHEAQHGIQEVEGFARGSNHAKANRWSFVENYERVKNTPEYLKLQTPRERLIYVRNAMAEESFQENELSDKRRYRQAGGEIEARDVAKRADFTTRERYANAPDLSGNMRYAQDSWPDFIDMLLDMGYSEEEITRIGGVHYNG